MRGMTEAGSRGICIKTSELTVQISVLVPEDGEGGICDPNFPKILICDICDIPYISQYINPFPPE